jgi:putative chitinase
MTISIAQLDAIGVAAAQAALFAGPLSDAADQFGIDTPLRLAAFVAECAFETRMFTHLSEDLDYSHADRIVLVFGRKHFPAGDEANFVHQPEALANRVYANRGGNGDEASGDGWRFRGAGAIQLTFHDGHAKCADALGRPLETFGDWLRSATGAAMSGAWYWSTNDINAQADDGDIDGCTRKINPAMEGAPQRRVLYARAVPAFGA